MGPGPPTPPSGSAQPLLVDVADDALLHALADAMPHLTWLSAGEGGAEFFSSSWVRFTGRAPDELRDGGWLRDAHPDDQARMRDMSPEAFVDGSKAVGFRLRRHDGEYRWMEVSGTAVRSPDGAIQRLIATTQDVTERRHQEAELRELGSQLASALDIADLGRFVRYLREDRLDADERLCAMFGYGPGRPVERPGPEDFLASIHPDDVPRVTATITGAMDGRPYSMEYRILRPGAQDTEVAWIAARGRVEHDAAGPWRMVGVTEDVTVRKRDEQRRAAAQRRDALAVLFSGIAHDFGNIVGAIASNAHLAVAESERGIDPGESLREIQRGARLAAELSRRMMDASREGSGVREPVLVSEVVDEALALLRPTLPSTVRVVVRCPAEPLTVHADPTQLHQVVLNLLTNAGQALSAGGTITVSLAASETGGIARLIVHDDGSGMPEAVAARAFDPFFTTKPPGEGTGLGLATVRTIVRDHGGTVHLRTSEGGGTTVEVELPTAPPVTSPAGMATAVAGGAPSIAVPTDPDRVPGGPRVLYVDDEVALARLAARAFPVAGCTAVTFTDPLEAARAFEADPDAFDVLVTDQSMPGLTGLELAQRVRTLRPAFPVVLTSGYLTDQDRTQAQQQAIDAVLLKPCTLDELVGAIRRLVPSEEFR